MEPIMNYNGFGRGWSCLMCRFECMGLNDALLHAEREHGKEACWDEEGDIWDSVEHPDNLRRAGVI